MAGVRWEDGLADFRALNLDQQALDDANKLFDWRAVAPLPDGRLLGKPSKGKRDALQKIPDNRILLLNKIVPLAGKSVLEVGCFEGLHTLGLRHFTDNVTAIDVRPANVFKTLARLSMHGADAKVFVADCETMDASFGTFDVCFHIGVLYHLVDPVRHLQKVASLASTLYLDTHVAPPNRRLEKEQIDGEEYSYITVTEGGWADPFSGKHKTSKHLALESLRRAITKAGYGKQKLLQYRDERNGPRVLIVASRVLDLAKVRETPVPTETTDAGGGPSA